MAALTCWLLGRNTPRLSDVLRNCLSVNVGFTITIPQGGEELCQKIAVVTSQGQGAL